MKKAAIPRQQATSTSCTIIWPGRRFGNVRAVVGSAGISQYTDYDPWGLALWGGLSGGNSGVPPSTNRNKFNGKEAVGEVGNEVYDFGARLQDAAIGRWGVVDPLAELFTSESGYSYAGNNPVRMIDPTGMSYQESYQSPPESGFSNGYTNTNIDPYHATGAMGFVQGALGNLGDLSAGDPPGKGKNAVNVLDSPNVRHALAKGSMAERAEAYGSEVDAIQSDNTFENLLIGTKFFKPVGAFISRFGAIKLGGSIRNINRVGGKLNCANCAIATDATLAGRTASALNTLGPTAVTVLEKEFGSKFIPNLTITSVESMVSQAGQRGIIFGNRGVGQVGHFFNVINQNGIIRFLDGQSGKVAELTGYKNFWFLPTN